MSEEKTIKRAMNSIESYVRHVYSQGYEDGARVITCANPNCKYNDHQGRCTCDAPMFSWGHVHTVNDGFVDIWECKSFVEQQNTKSLEFFQKNKGEV